MKTYFTFSLIDPHLQGVDKEFREELEHLFERLRAGCSRYETSKRSYKFYYDLDILCDFAREDIEGIPSIEPSFTISDIVSYSKKCLSLEAGYKFQSILIGMIKEKEINVTQRELKLISSIPEGIIERDKNNTNNHIDPYEALLMEMIKPMRAYRRWKEILMPYHAAVVEKVLPKWSHKTFKEKIGLDVPSASYSEWMSNGSYKPEDLEPYAEQFAQLKRQIDNSK